MQEYTIQNDYIALSVLDYGLRIKEIFLKPIQQNAVLAYAENSEYLQDVNFLGATIGPNANRIKDGKFSITGTAVLSKTVYTPNIFKKHRLGVSMKRYLV